MKTWICACSLAIAIMVLADSSAALPRFASRTGAKCAACHENPSGGGLRKVFGVRYGRDALPVPTWSQELGLDEFTNKLTDVVTIGADFRTLYFYQQIPDTSASSRTNVNAFWQMQGDVYLNFQLAKKVNIYLDKGLYSGFEIFGLLSILPGRGYLKIGKFVPNYGTKLDDHRAFIRQYTGFSPEFGRPELTGGEVGFLPGPFSFTAGVYNSMDGFGAGTTNKKAFLGRVDAMFELTDDMNLGLGGNIFAREDASGTKTTLFGGLGSFSYDDFTIFGEADWRQTKFGGTKITALITYIEVNYVVTQGLDLKVAYDFYDPDVDLKNGSISRYSFGFEFFPLTGVEVRPLYRIAKDEPVDLRNDEFDLLFHFYF